MNTLSHPQQLPILCFAEFVERFSYWGLQSILVIYLTQRMAITSLNAFAIYGTFTAFTFALSVAGGFLADKMLGFRRALIIGILFTIIGNVSLVFSNMHFFS